MTDRRRASLRAGLLGVLLTLFLSEPSAGHGPTVAWQPAHPTIGAVAWLTVQGVEPGATIEGSVDGRPLRFFAYAGGYAALTGFDLESKAGDQPWRLAVLVPGEEPRLIKGRVRVGARTFLVQRLTLPPSMVDLDPETERRALSERDQLRTLYQTVTSERLWRGRFVRPVAGTEAGTGFGARRIINGRARSPHSGLDYSAPLGAPVVAVNDGRVALVADHFFPGRLVVLDHGLALFTLYFHLDQVEVAEGERVSRGQTIGTVGATGRATGPHLHFGVQVGAARVDPVSLLDLAVRD